MKRRTSQFFFLFTVTALVAASIPVSNSQEVTVPPPRKDAPPPPLVVGSNTASANAPENVDPLPSPALVVDVTKTPTQPSGDTTEFVTLPGEARDTEPSTQAGETASQTNLMSITLDDVELADVVRMFTRVSNANIIASPSNLVGRVTVSLNNVQWQPALESILDMNGLALVEKTPASGVYSIAPRPVGMKEPMEVQSFVLHHGVVEQIEPVVKAMLVDGGTVSRYNSKNALVVRSTAANLNDIKKIVEEVDTLREQVFIEAKFMELDDGARKDLGVDWEVLANYGIGARSLSWSTTDTRTRTGSRQDQTTLTDNRNRTDTLDKRYDMDGQRFDTANNPPGRLIGDSTTLGRNLSATEGLQYQDVVNDVRTAVLGADDFKLILSALKQINGITIVSNPKIIVANNETARIHIGEKEPNIKGTVTAGQQGQANTTTYALDGQMPYFDYGISLDVTPTVNTASNITVAIVPTLTRFTRNKTAPDGNTYPVTATKEIKTVFALESGKTAAIGGLTETTEREVEKKIPLLGDIPLLGKYLFSHRHNENLQSETIIFVTVGLAQPQSIIRESGLPEETTLVRKKLIKSTAEKKAREADLEEARDKADVTSSETTGKSKARLLRRRK